MTETKVRVAVAEDIPAIIRMGHQFHALTAYAKLAPIEDEAVSTQLFAMVRSVNGDVVFVAEREDHELVGMLGAVITTPWFSDSYRVMQEIFWWVDPAARKQHVGSLLLEALEAWWPTCSRGLLMVRTPNIEIEMMDRLYQAKGFVNWDGYYMKTR